MKASFLVAAPMSGSGKTTIARGLMALLRQKGYRVQPFKCGPDYIDTKFHASVCGRPSVNLDTFMATPEHVQELFERYGADADVCIVEGMMGLFDGYDRERGSAYEIARVLGIPVVLVVDARSAAYSMAALLSGFIHFREDISFAGVIFNKVGSERHYAMLRQVCHDLSVACLGYLPRTASLEQGSRYLGLDFSQQAETASLVHLLEQHVDWHHIVGEASKLCVVGEASKLCLVGEASKLCVVGEASKLCVVGEASKLHSPVVGEASKLCSPVVSEASKLHNPVVGESSKLCSPVSEASKLHSPVVGEASKLHSPVVSEASKLHSPVVGEASKLHNPVGEASNLQNPAAAKLGIFTHYAKLGSFTHYAPQFVDTNRYIHITTDKLPHWQQEGKTAYVTFRLNDSLPQTKLQELQAFKAQWLNEHPLPWNSHTNNEYEKNVRRKTEKWLDQGYGSCILSRADIRQIVVNALLFHHGTRYILHHFVIMPNHVHLLISPIGNYDLNKAIGSVKRFSANAINKVLGTHGTVWQRLVFDHLVRDSKQYEAIVKYINDNPHGLPPGTFSLFSPIVGEASKLCVVGEASKLNSPVVSEASKLHSPVVGEASKLCSPVVSEASKLCVVGEASKLHSPVVDKASKLHTPASEASQLHTPASEASKPHQDIQAYDCKAWKLHPLRVLIARNAESFSFVYQEVIDSFDHVTFFDPEKDVPNFDGIDLLYLPGGYPEKHLEALAANEACRKAIKDYAERGGHVIAECGGMMYLCKSIVGEASKLCSSLPSPQSLEASPTTQQSLEASPTTQQSLEASPTTQSLEASPTTPQSLEASPTTGYPMCGVLPYVISARKADRKLSLGYRRFVLDGREYRGHEFHYTQFLGEKPQSAAQVYNAKGEPVDTPVFRYKNVLASYTHLYAGFELNEN